MSFMTRVSVVLLASVAAAVGCSRKETKGLPAATDWQAPAAGGGRAMPGVPTGRTAPADPHAGVPGAPAIGRPDPHAGVPGAPPLGDGAGGMGGAAGDPHAGVAGAPPLGDGLAMGDHGAGGGLAVDQLGLPPPDRTRPIDESKFLAGTVSAPPAHQGKIPAGAAIYLSVRPADAAGQPAGKPVAVDKLVATGAWPLHFRITEAQAMVGGTAFGGPVVIAARYDQDGEAMSKQPGDITGTARATIPADGLVITLDTIQP